MTIYSLKPAFQNLLRPLVNTLAAQGITANQITILSCLMSVTFGLALYGLNWSGLWLTLPAVQLLRMMLNAVDGMLAREHHMVSTKGFVLNEIGDLVSDAALYLSFMVIPGLNAFYVYLFILIAWLGEIVSILGYSNLHQRLNHGPLGKSDRAFIMSVIGIGYALFPSQLSSIANILFFILSVLAMLTLINRFKEVVAQHD